MALSSQPPGSRAAEGRGLLGAVFAEHRLALLLVAGYLVVAAPLLGWGLSGDWQLRFGYRWLLGGWVAGSAIVLLAARLRGRLAERLRLQVVAGALLVLALAVPFQSTFNSVKQVLPRFVPFSWDARLAALDRTLHGGVDPWRFFAWILRDPLLLQALDRIYVLWFVLLLGVVVTCGWSTRRRLRARLLVAILLAFSGIGTVGGFALSSAGPCYYGQVVSGPDPYAELVTALAARVDRDGMLLFAVENQRSLWEGWQRGWHQPFGGISAMPSMHIAMVVLVALAAGAVDRRLGAAAWAFALLTFVGSVALAWHYAVDGYVSGLAAAGLWAWVGRWRSIRALPDGPELS